MSAGRGQDPLRIVLTGFMGSGKTTVGRLLASRLGWSFADLDAYVEAREGITVPETFARRGEAYFRQAELSALGDLLTRERLVIALGGGAPETPALALRLQASLKTSVVHLHAPFEVLYTRCLLQAQDPTATERPLAREREAAHQRYLRRQPVYTALAHYTADVAASEPAAVVQAILQSISVSLTSP